MTLPSLRRWENGFLPGLTGHPEGVPRGAADEVGHHPCRGRGQAGRGAGEVLLQLRRKTFIEHILGALREVVDEIVLAARDPAQCERFSHLDGVRCVSDIRKGIGPTGGLHAGVLAARGDLVIVVACDMPCINPAGYRASLLPHR